MYKIIGGDGQQYGPVTESQIRDWVVAGRANGQSLAQAEGSLEWKPLSSFSEFSDLASLAIAPPLIAATDQRKSKLVAGLLGLLIPWSGVHRFYLGYVAIGVAQLLVSILTCGLGSIWGFIEGILILVGSGITTDADGRPLKEQ
ncbi:MAG: NINE protein [Verrucomicrobia subdivision 3 bacterium]|nr:NINE protein [Limisphaerales bacterium]